MELPNAATLILLSWFLLAAHHIHYASAAKAKRSIQIVHMDKSLMPRVFSNHHQWYSSLLSSIKSPENPNPKPIYTYDHAFHGFSVVLSEHELSALKKSAGVLSSHPDAAISPHTTHTTQSLSLNTVTGLWPASNYGDDVIIGIIDTGIRPESPSFNDYGLTDIPSRWKGACFNSSFCNNKIIGARYFNKGFRAASTTTTTTPDDSARDEDGHGTHVASIAAGSFVEDVSFFGYAAGTARGVAPRARVAAYKVLWPGCVSSDILAGIDQAVADGVDIISISLGAEEAKLYMNPLSIASFGAREKGILVSLSAGNKGPDVGSVRSGIPWAVVVASGTVDRWFAGTLTLGNDIAIMGWTTFPGRDNGINHMPLVYDRALSACNSNELLSEAPDQSIVICDLSVGNLDFKEAMGYLTNSSVRAAIIVADEQGVFRSNSFPFPGVVMSPAEARVVIDYISKSDAPVASIDFQQTILGTGPRAAPALSDSSSRGPGQGYDGILKPDLTAPGVLILAAYNPYAAGPRLGKKDLYTDYNLLSGTSMACPHVSGLAALLKAAHPGWSPAAIQSAMMTTANPLDNTNRPIKDMALGNERAASPLGIGSGMIDPNRALSPGLVYDASTQDLVDLVCSMGFSREHTQTIVRSSYNCSNPSSDLNYPSFVATFDAAQGGMMLTRSFRRTATNVGRGAATYGVKVDAPVNTRITIRPDTLVFREKDEKQSYLLTIQYVADMDTPHRDGYITWIESTGRHTVRSPIMVSALS